MSKIILIAILFLLSTYCLSQSHPLIELDSPTLLIKGMKNEIRKPKKTDNIQFYLQSYGMKVIETDTTYEISLIFEDSSGVIFDSPYFDTVNYHHYIDFYTIHQTDTTFLERKYYEEVPAPSPRIYWGSIENKRTYVYRDSIENLRKVILHPGWETNRNIEYEIKSMKLTIENPAFSFEMDSDQFTDEVLTIIANAPMPLAYNLKIMFVGLETWETVNHKGQICDQAVLDSIHNQWREDIKQKKLELYAGRNIYMIRAPMVDKNDTIFIENPGNLFIHFDSGREWSGFTIISQDEEVIVDIEVGQTDSPEDIIDFREIYGTFIIKSSGYSDGSPGSYESILVIKPSE